VEESISIEHEWAQHQAPVYNFMRRMGLDAPLAADLAQETFVRALRGARRFRGEGSVRAWVLGIARNVFREWLRSGKREVPVAVVTDQSTGGAATAERVDVERVLARLDPDHREILVLRFVLDLPSREVSAALGITDDAVRQRVFRAKAEFREVWGP
jgi:RNA polymerase sigma-70 factor (ECF subfamily)